MSSDYPVGLGIGPEIPPQLSLAWTQAAEAAGLDAVWFHEAIYSRDAAPVIAAAAAHTTHIALGAGCFSAIARHPAMLAMTAATLQELSGGRFLLGVGTGFPARLAQAHLLPNHLFSTFAESVGLVKRLLSGTNEPYHGSAYHVERLLSMPVPTPVPPLYIAGWKPKMLALTAQLADGYLARPVESPKTMTRLVGRLRQHRQGAEDLQIAGYILCAFADTRPHARQMAREDPFVVYQLSVMDDDVLLENDFDPQLKRVVSQALQRGDPKSAIAAVPDRWLDTFTACGTPAQVADALWQWHQAGLEMPVLQPIKADNQQVAAAIEAAQRYQHA